MTGIIIAIVILAVILTFWKVFSRPRVPEEISADLKAVLTLMGQFMRVSSAPERVCTVLDMREAKELGVQIPLCAQRPAGNSLQPDVDSQKIAGYAHLLEKEFMGDTEMLGKELATALNSEKHKALAIFCMKVLLVDDKVQASSLQLLEGLVKGMGMDEEWFRQTLLKSIPVERLDANEDITPLFLGLHSLANDNEKKAYLTRMYLTWNPVSTNCDPLKSSRAKAILRLVKSCRAKLERQ